MQQKVRQKVGMSHDTLDFVFLLDFHKRVERRFLVGDEVTGSWFQGVVKDVQGSGKEKRSHRENVAFQQIGLGVQNVLMADFD